MISGEVVRSEEWGVRWLCGMRPRAGSPALDIPRGRGRVGNSPQTRRASAYTITSGPIRIGVGSWGIPSMEKVCGSAAPGTSALRCHPDIRCPAVHLRGEIAWVASTGRP